MSIEGIQMEWGRNVNRMGKRIVTHWIEEFCRRLENVDAKQCCLRSRVRHVSVHQQLEEKKINK